MRTLLVVLALTSSSLLADTIRLKDGTVITGTIRRSDKLYEVTDSNGQVRAIADDQVVSIQRASTAPSASDAMSRLKSHRRALENLSDIDQILGRYETLLKQIDGTPAAGEARKDVEKWRDYKARGMVRVGRDWLAPDALAKLEEEDFLAVDQARNLLKQNRSKEALAAAEKVLDREPDNVGALYIKGLCLYRQEQIPAARKAFDKLVDILPNHGPSLNNLAAIQWRQNSIPAAIGNYLKAMQAMPLTATIHNNVAEAINNLPRDQRESLNTRKLVAQYAQDEPRLEATMQHSGWYRWGSTWVTDEQLREVQEQERQVRDRLDYLSQQFDDTQDVIQQIDDEIARNTRDMTRLENAAYAQDANGNWIRLPLPQNWYNARDDTERLKVRREQQLDKLENIRREGQDTRARMAIPPYTNQHKLMDEQYTPTRFRSAATNNSTRGQPQMPVAAPAPAGPDAGVPTSAPAVPGPIRAEPVR